MTVGGGAVSGMQIGETVSEDLGRAEMLALPFLALLSLLFFRGRAALMPLVVGMTTVLGTFLVLTGVNQIYGLSVFALNLVIGLGLGLAIDYTLFMVTRFREELAKGDEPRQAVRTTMSTAGRTIVFSAATVAGALATLTVFPLGFAQSMGIAGASVAVVAALATLADLARAARAVGPQAAAQERPRRRRGPGPLAPPRPRRDAPPRRDRRDDRGADARRRPPGARRELDAGRRERHPHRQERPHRQRRDRARLRRHRRDARHGRGHGADRRCAGRSRVRRRGPPAGRRPVGHPGRGPRQRDLAPDRRRARRSGGHDRTRRSSTRSARSTRAFPAAVTGPAAEFADQQEAISSRLPLAVVLLCTLTFAVLWLMTGSVVLPAKAIVMNALTVGAALAPLLFIYQGGRFEDVLGYTSNGGIEPTDFLVTAALVFALSTDYGVFLLGRIKEARDSGETDREAVAVGLAKTGRVVTAAAILLAVAIGVFSTSSISFIQQIGIATATGVLLDAFVVRTLLVPSLMVLLGKWNWWSPRPLRRLHHRIGIEEHATPAHDRGLSDRNYDPGR